MATAIEYENALIATVIAQFDQNVDTNTNILSAEMTVKKVGDSISVRVKYAFADGTESVVSAG